MLLIAPALGATLTVPGDYDDLASAVAAAESGDRIEIDAGTYSGAVEIDIDLEIVGAGSGSTFLEAEEEAVLEVDDATVSLSGLAIEAGGTRAITATNATLTLSDLSFSEAANAGHGGAVYVLSSTLEADDCTFNDSNVEQYNGGHLYSYGSTVTITNSAFSAGRAEKGGAIYGYSTDLYVENTTFTGNQADLGDDTGRGGAIRAEGGSTTIVGCDFTFNTCDQGFGGAVSTFGSDLIVSDSSFVSNSVTRYYGGALAIWDSDATITTTSFEDNDVSREDDDDLATGGAIVFVGSDAGTLSVQSSVFLSNDSDGYGGAVRFYAGDGVFESTAFEANTGGSGGAVYSSSPASLTIQDSSFNNNVSAANGGGVRWRPINDDATLVVQGSSFASNEAPSYGGAIYGYAGGSWSIEGSTFLDNEGGTGGAVMTFDIDEVSYVNNRFCGNASAGTSISDGGAIVDYQSGGDGHVLTNNVFAENRAESWGGAVNLFDGGDAVVRNNHFLANEAPEGGAGLALRANDAEVLNNLFAYHPTAPALDSDENPTLSGGWNAWYENDIAADEWSFDRTSDDSLLDTDPELDDWIPGDGCSGAFYPTLTSPLVDAGSPDFEDPDGSRSDIGAFGGPEADDAFWTDEDEDGFVEVYDCDDGDASVNPDAEEVPYDGLDQDCDGEDLVDVDGDGFEGGEDGDDCDDEDAAVYPGADDAWYDGVDSDCAGNDDFDADEDGFAATPEGEDCNDQDPDVNPDAVEIAEDGVDQDCDGSDATVQENSPDEGTPTKKFCGCASVTPSAGWTLGLLALIALRRRSERG